MSLSPVQAARTRHPLAAVARRTGIGLPSDAGTVTVRCVLPAHGHPDRRPSLRLFLDDGRYYCFGCGSKGDVVQWVRDLTGTSVLGAITVLDAGAALVPAWPPGPPATTHWLRPAGSAPASRFISGGPPQPGRTPASRVKAALEEAWAYYTRPPCHRYAAGYLARRGIGLSAVEACTGGVEAGYAPTGPTGLARHLAAGGFTATEVTDAGLARVRGSNGALVDFYRGRVLLPFRDERGEVVGFAGRDVTGRPGAPKYLNPPSTAVYSKQVNLYRPLPVPATGSGGRVVVVEGTIDALAIAAAAATAGQAGSICPLTQSGRELSGAQLGWLVGLGVPVVLAFDADRAGADSTIRYTAAAARVGLRVQVAALPAGHDPASWLAVHGPAGLAAFSPGHRRPGGLPFGLGNTAGAEADPPAGQAAVSI